MLKFMCTKIYKIEYIDGDSTWVAAKDYKQVLETIRAIKSIPDNVKSVFDDCVSCITCGGNVIIPISRT